MPPFIINTSNLLRILILWFPIAFMLIKHGIHITLYGICLLLICEVLKGSSKLKISKIKLPFIIAFCGIFFATVIQQLINLNFNIRAFDGPSRLLIAGTCFIYLAHKKINSLKLIRLAIPIGLIILFVYLLMNPQFHWGNRWANSFVDPNSLGGQATILAFLCLVNIQVTERSLINILSALGAICGLIISVKAESRGGWATLPFMTIIWLVIQLKVAPPQSDKKQFLSTILIVGFLILCTSVAIAFNEAISNRLSHAIYEVTTWFKDPLIYTSVGARLSMWAASLILIQENIWGYGEIAIKEIALNHPLYSGLYHNGFKDLIQAGPHSDLMSKGLSLGIIGILTYLLLILIPLKTFIKKMHSSNQDIQNVCRIGIIYLTGIFIAGLFNEALSLKYLCSFYGLMIACLAAQALQDEYESLT